MKTLLHSGSLGDVIYSLPTIRSLIGEDEATLYLRPGVQDTIPAWAGVRQPERMNLRQAVALLPILNEQPGLHAALWSGQEVDYDLDAFRTTTFDLGRGDIARYYCYAFPGVNPVLWEPWLRVKPSTEFRDYILVNRTKRYRSSIHYKFLSGRSDVIFLGYGDEYTEFAKDCPGVPQVVADDYRQLAAWIAGCKLFVGNQSFCFSLAESLKVKRILELYRHAPNVIIHGPDGWDVMDQQAMETVFRNLI